jgi:neutral ceramidase
LGTAGGFRAGAAGLNVDPPLGLPMMGVVRRDRGAESRLGPLEVTAAAFDDGTTRVVICGVDTLGIQSPEVDVLRDRVEAATGATRAGILLNWNHTHHAPPGGLSVHGSFGERVMEPDAATTAYVEHLHGRIVEVCRLACERLEPAWIRWGLGEADEAMNRRERDPDGMVRRIGWHPDGMADVSVPVLQAIREDNSAVATLVGYGAHTVTTGVEVIAYSPDYPGPLRDAVRAMTGGECVFLQGAAGNIMPRVAFDDSCTEWIRMGRRLALEAVHAVADQPAWPLRFTPTGFGSGTPVGLFRRVGPDGAQPALAAVEERVDLPLLPRPSRDEVVALRERAEAEVREAEAAGATEPELRFLRFHGLNWLRRAEAEICSDRPTTAVSASINAVRIGDGAIVTGAGEVFTEIGLAVKERSPADVTLYAGYTNGCVSYLPAASEYPLGGYEPAYGNKTYGLPAQVAPEADRILVETGTRLVRSLFPERPLPEPDDWLASGALPTPPVTPRPERPAEEPA